MFVPYRMLTLVISVRKQLLLRNLEIKRCILRELRCGSIVSTNADDINVTVSSYSPMKLVGETLKEYQEVAGANIKSE